MTDVALMALAPKLEIKQSQSLMLTPQLRQAINLLQMNNLELNEFVEQELAANPLLEREEDINTQDYDDKNAAKEQAFGEEEFVNDWDEQNHFDDFASDASGYNSYENADWSDYRQVKAHRGADDDFDFISERARADKSFYDIIGEQIDLHFTSGGDRLLALVLLERLDPSGYFTADIKELAGRLKVSSERLQSVLDKLKEFEPVGIFAQNLSECLKIQLQDRNMLNEQMEKFLDNLSMAAEGKWSELAKICGCSSEKVMVMLKQVKELNPKPAADYIKEFNVNIVPDVIVQRNAKGEYRVELNSLTLPRLLINHRYYAEMKKDKKAARYLRDNMSQASFLIKAMHSRATNVLRIAEEIVLRQYQFLEHGVDKLKSMTLKEVAQALELSESTVSRATANKYMATPNGTFEFKYFFSNAAGSYLGDEDTSTTVIKHKLKKLIEQEDPKHILSDEKLVELLENGGVKIARRTVAKYREALGIPTSAERKRRQRILKI